MAVSQRQHPSGTAERTAQVPRQLSAAAQQAEGPLLRELETRPAGLTTEEVRTRRVRFGPNVVARDHEPAVSVQILRRLANPLNLLLLALAAISLITGQRNAALLIIVMVVLSVSLGFLQEHRSNRAAERLRAMVHTTATVRRCPAEAVDIHGATDSETVPWAEVPITDLVPGDIVHLSAGDLVPADLRLLSAKDLHVSEATLTGEAMPVEKCTDVEPAGDADALRLRNVCYMGTSVVSGTATAVVVLTGERAYFGGLANLIAGERPPTDFDRGMNRFAWLMIRFVLVMAPLVLLINGLTKGDWLEALLFAVAVAVGLTPELLPMIVTVNLAMGALAMSRKQVIVKRLNSIQNFGAMDILCTDKTGTLTQDRIVLERHVDLLGADSEEVLLYAYLNSRYQSGLKNLLDVAILRHAEAERLAAVAAQYEKWDEVPFDFSRRRMSVAVRRGDRRLLICKGAVEEVFAASRSGRANGQSFALDASHLAMLQQTSGRLNADGFRVIAVAYRELPPTHGSCSVADEVDLTLLGYVAFLDPPKESAGRAIAALRLHGIGVKILTGDNEIITRKVCADVGMPITGLVLGRDTEALTDAELGAVAEGANVFAKLSPSQKARVIGVLQDRRHVVGFLGDGINDGPALKRADVGVSVDSAVDIARETADIIMLEKSLLVLDEGVVEGRKVFANIIKYIRMGASSNFGNMLSVIGASAWLPFLPMAPLQVLTNNLLYDFSQTSIPSDNVDAEYLMQPRRWEIGNIGRYMLCIGPVSSLFDYATYCLMYFVFAANTRAQAGLFQTGWFVESLLSQTLIIHVIRTRRIPFVESRASTALLITSAAICGVGVWLPTSPLAPALGLVRLPPLYWPLLALMLAAYLALTHGVKTWFHRRFGLN